MRTDVHLFEEAYNEKLIGRRRRARTTQRRPRLDAARGARPGRGPSRAPLGHSGAAVRRGRSTVRAAAGSHASRGRSTNTRSVASSASSQGGLQTCRRVGGVHEGARAGVRGACGGQAQQAGVRWAKQGAWPAAPAKAAGGLRRPPQTGPGHRSAQPRPAHQPRQGSTRQHSTCAAQHPPADTRSPRTTGACPGSRSSSGTGPTPAGAPPAPGAPPARRTAAPPGPRAPPPAAARRRRPRTRHRPAPRPRSAQRACRSARPASRRVSGWVGGLE